MYPASRPTVGERVHASTRRVSRVGQRRAQVYSPAIVRSPTLRVRFMSIAAPGGPDSPTAHASVTVRATTHASLVGGSRHEPVRAGSARGDRSCGQSMNRSRCPHSPQRYAFTSSRCLPSTLAPPNAPFSACPSIHDRTRDAPIAPRSPLSPGIRAATHPHTESIFVRRPRRKRSDRQKCPTRVGRRGLRLSSTPTLSAWISD